MQSGGVLVLGCTEEFVHSGLKADARAISAQNVPVKTVSTGSAIKDGKGHVDVVETASSVLINRIGDALQEINCKVVKIGALFSNESINTVSGILQQKTQLISVMDVEPFFKTGSAPKPELITALRIDLLPSIDVLSATVAEAEALLHDAGIAIGHPNSIHDVKLMAEALRNLGPKYTIIKREILDEDDKATTLHYVLCGSTEPTLVTSRSENPRVLFGASYSIPPAIAAHLAKGYEVPEAVSAGYKFVEDMLKVGEYFEFL